MQSGGRREPQPKNLFGFANAAQFKLPERLEASVAASRGLCKPRREQDLSIKPLAEFFDSNHFVNRRSNHGEVKPVSRAHVAVQHLADVQSDINIGKRQACRFTFHAKAADDRLGLLTPVLKGMFTDAGFANAVKAQQVLGGHGYVCEWGMEQFVRDARITMIYEGANGIQALDLVRRKLTKDDGRAMKAFLGEARDFISENKSDSALAEYLAPLEVALGQLEQATTWIAQRAKANPDEIGAASTEYLHLCGLTVLDCMWAKIAKAVIARQAAGTSNPELDAWRASSTSAFCRSRPRIWRNCRPARRRSWPCRTKCFERCDERVPGGQFAVFSDPLFTFAAAAREWRSAEPDISAERASITKLPYERSRRKALYPFMPSVAKMPSELCTGGARSYYHHRWHGYEEQ